MNNIFLRNTRPDSTEDPEKNVTVFFSSRNKSQSPALDYDHPTYRHSKCGCPPYHILLARSNVLNTDDESNDNVNGAVQTNGLDFSVLYKVKLSCIWHRKCAGWHDSASWLYVKTWPNI